MSGSPGADADRVDEPLAAVVERERPRLRERLSGIYEEMTK
jgi:hypothetical protein